MFPNNELRILQAGAGNSQIFVCSARQVENVANGSGDQSSLGDDAIVQWAHRHQNNSSDAFSTHSTNIMKVPNMNNNVTFLDQAPLEDRKMPASTEDNFALKNVVGNDRIIANGPPSMQHYEVNANVNAMIQSQSQSIGLDFDGYLGDMMIDAHRIALVSATSNPPIGDSNNHTGILHFNTQGEHMNGDSNSGTLSRPDEAQNHDESRLMEFLIANDYGRRRSHEAMIRSKFARSCHEHKNPHYKNDTSHTLFAFGTAVNDCQASLSTTTEPFRNDFTNQSMVPQSTMRASFQNHNSSNPLYRDNFMFLHGTTNDRSETRVSNSGQDIKISAVPGTSQMIARGITDSFTMPRFEPQISPIDHSSLCASDGVVGMVASNVPQQSKRFGTSCTTAFDADVSPRLHLPNSQAHSTLKQTFVLKLMQILSVKESQSAIRWMPTGDAFCVLNAKDLVKNVLPKYFKETKYPSFTRKLNRWGFKNCTPQSSSKGQLEAIYCHEMFLRDRPELCEYMKAGRGRKRGSPTPLATHQLDSSSFQGFGHPQMLRRLESDTLLTLAEVGTKVMNQSGVIQSAPSSDVYRSLRTNPNTLDVMPSTSSKFTKRNSAHNELLPSFFQSPLCSDMVPIGGIPDGQQEERTPDSTLGVSTDVFSNYIGGNLRG